MKKRLGGRKTRVLSDDHIAALREFADDEPGIIGQSFRDSKVFGLMIFIGAQANVWRFKQQRRVKGKMTAHFKTLGKWPGMSTEEARKEALIYAGSVAAGTAAPGKRAAMPFVAAFERYLEHLKAQAERRGKAPRWYLNARKLYETHIKTEWEGWSLYEMSTNPRAVAAWHAKLAKTIPTSAEH
jgi:hypothetical protein